jgi:hypothetical protein
VRLRWPFGRGTPNDGQPIARGAGDAGAPGVETTTRLDATAGGPGAGPVAGVAATGAWATLPPIQRAIGAAPVVAPSARFLAGVPGHTPLPPIVQPLGHERAPTAPPGLLVAHVSPVPSLTSSAPLATHPAQRRPVSAAAARDLADAPPEPPPVASPVQPATLGDQPAEPAPVRTLAPVAPAATVTPPARSLTLAAASPTPIVPPTARRPAAAGSPAPGTTSTLPMPRNVSRWAEAGAGPAASTMRGSDAGAPSSGPPGPLPARTTGDTDPRPSHGSGGPRRPGLGAPISAAPTSAVTQRLPMRTPPRPAASREGPPPPVPDASRLHAGGTGGGTPAGPGAAANGGGPGNPASVHAPSVAQRAASGPRSLPVLPVARRRHEADHPRPGAESTVAAGSSRGTPVQDVPSPARRAAVASSIAPLTGVRPLRPTAQRRAAPVGAEVVAGNGAEAIPAPVVPARWTRDDNLPPTVTSSGPPTTIGEPETVPLRPAGRAGRAAAAAVELAHDSGPREIVFPPRDGLPGPGPDPASGPAFPSAVQRSAAAPALRRAAGGAELGRTGPGGWPATASGRGPATSGTPTLALARSVITGPAADLRTAASGGRSVPGGAVAPAPVVQASRDGGASGLPDITATPVVQRVDGAAPAAPSEDDQSDGQLDELAQALFSRIQGRLRAEVIHEREARGLTFDAF